MNRRGFLGFALSATGGIFVPKFGEWYREGSGILAPRGGLASTYVWWNDTVWYLRDNFPWASSLRRVEINGQPRLILEYPSGRSVYLTAPPEGRDTTMLSPAGNHAGEHR